MTRPWSLRLWPAHIIALILVAAAGALGCWQFSSWQDQRDKAAEGLSEAAPVPLTEAMGPDDRFTEANVGKRVRVAGVWLPGTTIRISDRTQGGTDGAWVATGVGVPGKDDPVMYVVRGWAPSLAAAEVDPPSGEVELVGWLQGPEGTGEVDQDPDDDVLPQLRIADLVQFVAQDLYGGFVIAGPDYADRSSLEPADPDALPQPKATTALRNLLYAIEWWAFGLFAAYIWWRYVADQVAGDRDLEASG